MAEVMTVYRPKYKIEGDFIEYNAVVNKFRVKFRELKIQQHIG